MDGHNKTACKELGRKEGCSLNKLVDLGECRHTCEKSPCKITEGGNTPHHEIQGQYIICCASLTVILLNTSLFAAPTSHHEDSNSRLVQLEVQSLHWIWLASREMNRQQQSQGKSRAGKDTREMI